MRYKPLYIENNHFGYDPISENEYITTSAKREVLGGNIEIAYQMIVSEQSPLFNMDLISTRGIRRDRSTKALLVKSITNHVTDTLTKEV